MKECKVYGEEIGGLFCQDEMKGRGDENECFCTDKGKSKIWSLVLGS
jgi:hypothetical protein